MIAKAILDLLTTLPGATRATTQSAGQPLQAFSDSLVAASKSFLQASKASDSNGKAGRQQKTVLDDATAPETAAGMPTDGTAVSSSPIATQLTQDASTSEVSLTSSQQSETDSGGRPDGLNGSFTQSLVAVQFAVNGSSSARTSSVPANFIRSARVHSSVNTVPSAAGAQTPTRKTSTVAAGLVGWNATAVMTNASQSSAAPANFLPAQMPLAAVTIPEDSTAAAGQTDRDLNSMEVAGSEVGAGAGGFLARTRWQTSVEPSAAPLQALPASSAEAGKSGLGTASQSVQNVAASEPTESANSFARAGSSLPSAARPQPTSAQAPIVNADATIDAASSHTDQPITKATGRTEGQPSFGGATWDESSTSVAQTPAMAPTGIQSDLTGAASKPDEKAPASGWGDRQPNIFTAGGLKAAVAESNAAPVQTLSHVTAATESVKAGEALPMGSVAESAQPVTAQSSSTESGTAQSNVVERGVAETNFASRQLPLPAVSTMAQSTPVGPISQPALDAAPVAIAQSVAGSTEAIHGASSISVTTAGSTNLATDGTATAQTDDVHRASVQPSIESGPLTSPEPTTSQSVPVEAAVPAARKTAAAEWIETQSIAIRNDVTTASVPQTIAVQSSFAPAQMQPEIDRDSVTSKDGETVQDLGTSQWIETRSSVAQSEPVSAGVPQTTATPASFVVSQIPSIPQTTAQAATIPTTGRLAEVGGAAPLVGSWSSDAQTSSVAADARQTIAVEPSDFPARTSLAGTGARQEASTSAISLPVQNVPSTLLAEPQPVAVPVGVRSSASAPLVVETKQAEPAAIQVDQANRTSKTAQLSPDAAPRAMSANVVPAENQPSGDVQPQIAPTSMPIVQTAAIEKAPVDAANQEPVQNAGAEGSDKGKTQITSTQMQPSVVVQSSIEPAAMAEPAEAPLEATSFQAPIAEPSIQPQAVSGVTGDAAQNQATAMPAGGDATAATVSVPEAAAIEASFTTTQRQFVEPARTQEPSTNAGSLLDQKAAPALQENPASVVSTGVAQMSAVESANVQPKFAQLDSNEIQSPVQLPAAQTTATANPEADVATNGNDKQSAVGSAVADAAPDGANSRAQNQPAKDAMNAIASGAQSAISNAPADQNSVPVVRAALNASVKVATAPALKTASADQAASQPAAQEPIPATTVTVPGGVAEQLAFMPLAMGPVGTGLVNASNLKSASTAKPQVNASATDKSSNAGQADAKKNSDTATVAGPKAGSQDGAQPGNQDQSGNPPQAQATTPAPVPVSITATIAAHSAVLSAPAQSAAAASSSNHSAGTSTADSASSSRTLDNPVHASTALPQTAPGINTAKLVQSMGQTEMRVGMRSNEFGNISISTAAGKDQVSAQISLEHGELAKTIAAHLPEIQARLGSNQPLDVRIDMNGAATRQGAGSFGGTSNGPMSNGSGDSSRNGRQQAGSMAASHQGSDVVEGRLLPAAAVLPMDYARLDIRV